MGLLSRDQLLAATTLPRETVPVPELGGEVCVRGLTGAERDQFEQEMLATRGKKTSMNLANIRARLVTLAAVDEAGARLFTPADVEALGLVRADVLDRLFAVAQRLSGLRDNDVEELGKASA